MISLWHLPHTFTSDEFIFSCTDNVLDTYSNYVKYFIGWRF